MITKLLNLTFLLSFQRSFCNLLLSFSVALVIYQIVFLKSTKILTFFKLFFDIFFYLFLGNGE